MELEGKEFLAAELRKGRRVIIGAAGESKNIQIMYVGVEWSYGFQHGWYLIYNPNATLLMQLAEKIETLLIQSVGRTWGPKNPLELNELKTYSQRKLATYYILIRGVVDYLREAKYIVGSKPKHRKTAKSINPNYYYWNVKKYLIQEADRMYQEQNEKGW